MSLLVALLLLVVAALAGMLLAALRLQREANPPTPVAALHGVSALAGVAVLLVVGMRTGFDGLLTLALVALALATVGGMALSGLHAMGRLIPIPGVFAHAAVASSGMLALAAALWLSG
ncbi:MAG: hypothetical protein KTR31_35480 [Myxococcales bacterium]|nr:hypothetical protein [Myxococcales bacterium]